MSSSLTPRGLFTVHDVLHSSTTSLVLGRQGWVHLATPGLKSEGQGPVTTPTVYLTLPLRPALLRHVDRGPVGRREEGCLTWPATVRASSNTYLWTYWGGRSFNSLRSAWTPTPAWHTGTSYAAGSTGTRSSSRRPTGSTDTVGGR